MPNNRIQQFKAFVSDFRSIRSVALKASIAAPCLGIWTKMSPPPALWNSLLTTIAECPIVVWAFQYWSDSSSSEHKRRMKWSLVTLFTCVIAVIAGLALLTVDPGPGRERVVEGFVLQPAVRQVLAATYTPENALRDKEYDAMAVWTKSSVVTVQLALDLSWIGMFGSLSVYLASFVVGLRQRNQ